MASLLCPKKKSSACAVCARFVARPSWDAASSPSAKSLHTACLTRELKTEDCAPPLHTALAGRLALIPTASFPHPIVHCSGASSALCSVFITQSHSQGRQWERAGFTSASS
ncbi:hypothetical protein B0H19DRAFT_1083389 [Mycena capillaripes]|nr:hypothetical protein B0H19DRAFT_1083389 [Mycena capillaripes]